MDFQVINKVIVQYMYFRALRLIVSLSNDIYHASSMLWFSLYSNGTYVNAYMHVDIVYLYAWSL